MVKFKYLGFLLFFTVFLLSACSVSKKLKVNRILSRAELSLDSVSLDSLVIDSTLFKELSSTSESILPNPEVISLVTNLAKGIISSHIGTAFLRVAFILDSPEKDSLWVESFDAVLTLDSLELPVSLVQKQVLIPGKQKVEFKTSVPIDSKVWALFFSKEATMKGVFGVAVKKNDSPMPLEFEFHKEITDKERKEVTDFARQKIMDFVIENWVEKLLL